MDNLFKKMEFKLYNFKILDTKINNIDLDINKILNEISISVTFLHQKKG